MTITYDDPTVNRSSVDRVHLSPELLEANRRLHELRTKQVHRSSKKERVTLNPKRGMVCCHVEVDTPSPPSSYQDGYPQPIHISQPLDKRHGTADLETANNRLKEQQTVYAQSQKSPIRQRESGHFDSLLQTLSHFHEIDVDGMDANVEVDPTDTVLVHPSIAVTLLQGEMVAVGRLWLLARSLDPAGSGHICLATLREKFTNKKSPYRLCGWRRMRMLLAQGEGTFWERDNEGRLWIYGVGRVAATLGLDHVEGVAVQVDVNTLLNIQSCRAHFYASWFSGRKTGNPISRATLTELTGVAEGQQRLYEQIANVDVRPCIAIGARYSLEGIQEEDYQRGAVRGHGRGVVFDFIDHKGKQGKAGERYVAWHLPNQYTGRHKRAGKSSRRNINRYLKRKQILEEKLALGNVDSVDTSDDGIVVPLFFPNVKAAGKRRKRVRTANEIYWEGTKSRSAQLWHVAPQVQGERK